MTSVALSGDSMLRAKCLAVALVAMMGCIGRPARYIGGVYVPATGVFSSSEPETVPRPIGTEPKPFDSVTVPKDSTLSVSNDSRNRFGTALDLPPLPTEQATQNTSRASNHSDMGEPPSAQSTVALLIYGGTNHDKFLGCLNCSEFDYESVCNEFGKYGSEYSYDSIWNEFSPFGSEFSASSPWNEFASGGSVPIVVDESGGFYGRLTINEYQPDAFGEGHIAKLYQHTDGDLSKVRKALCKAIR